MGKDSLLHSGLLGAVILLSGLTFALISALTLPIYLDEFTYAHAAWLISQGQVPYRDFALDHPPLAELASAPAFWFSQNAETCMMLIRCAFGALLVISAYLLDRESSAIPGVAFLLTISCGLFSNFMVQLRPDSMAVFLFIAGCYFLRREQVTAGGICVGLSVFSSEKAIIYGLAALFACRRIHLVRFVAIAAAISFFTYICLLLAAGPAPLMEFLVLWPLHRLTDYPSISAYAQIGPQVPQLVVYAGLAVIGLGTSSWPDRRFWLAFLVLGTGAYVLQHSPFAHSALPLLPPLIVLASRGLASLPLLLRNRRGVQIAVAALSIALLPLGDQTEPRTWTQRDLWNRIEQKVPPQSCVYDSTGTAINRPHGFYYFFHSGTTMAFVGPSLEELALAELARKNCAAMVIDERYYWHSEQYRNKLLELFPWCDRNLCMASPK